MQERAALCGVGGHDLAEQQVVVTGRDGHGELTAERRQRTPDPRRAAERVRFPFETIELGQPG